MEFTSFQRIVQDDHQIGASNAFQQLGVGADADLAGIATMPVVDDVAPPERGDDRDIVRIDEPLHLVPLQVRPTGSPHYHEGAFRLIQHPAQPFEGLSRRGRAGHRLDGIGIVDGALILQHVLGKDQDHRSRARGHRRMEGALDEFRDSTGVVDLGDPFRHRCEHLAEVVGLERLAFHLRADDLADEKDHRRGILERRMDAGGGVGRAGAAGDESDAGAPGEFAVGLRHDRHAALVPATDQPDVRMEPLEESRTLMKLSPGTW